MTVWGGHPSHVGVPYGAMSRAFLPAGCALLLAALAACGPADESGAEPAAPSSKEDAALATQEGKADWTFDICRRNGWYGDGECDWFCWERDEDCNPTPLGPVPAGSPARYPVVLAHGFDASPTNRWGFHGVGEALEADGHLVWLASVSPYNAVEVRAAQLAEQVDAVLAGSGAAKVNLVAHSMGGLDCRYLISSLGYGDRVASLTTISSPHRGAPVADLALKLLPGVADKAVNALAEVWGRRFSDLADDPSLRAALEALSTKRSVSFNEDNPDDARVSYRSWAGVSATLGIWRESSIRDCDGKLLLHEGHADVMDATLLPMAVITGGFDLTPNDGMATVPSAKWGAFQGCIPADHLDEVGQVRDDGPDPYSGFDHIRFYRNLAYDLARSGF